MPKDIGANVLHSYHRAAAHATGCKVEINAGIGYYDNRQNKVLGKHGFFTALETAGRMTILPMIQASNTQRRSESTASPPNSTRVWLHQLISYVSFCVVRRLQSLTSLDQGNVTYGA